MATEEQKRKANLIIHGAATSAAASSGAMAQGAVFGADTVVMTTIHIGMVAALGELFNQRLDKQAAMALVGTLAGAGVGVFAAKAILGFFPGLGNVANAAISATYTETLGWTCFNYFDEENNLQS